jgi:type 1 glutamine amidotransferase
MIADHPITRGVAPTFHARSWLYQVDPLKGDCTPLLLGAAVKGEEARKEIFGTPNPVAWTKTHNGARVFFTTLGHPQDFAEESMRRLVVNGIYWALGREDEIPQNGTNVELDVQYVAPQTTQAVPDPTLRRDAGQRYAIAEEGHPLGRLSPLVQGR